MTIIEEQQVTNVGKKRNVSEETKICLSDNKQEISNFSFAIKFVHE